MDINRAPVFLVLLTCVVGTLSSSGNDRGVPNSVERNRRYALSEFLIPPPLPQSATRVLPGGRTGRTANPHPVESPGYFSKFISWLNPFTSGTSVETPPPLPPPPPPPETLHPPKFLQSHVPPLPPSGPPSGFPLATLQVYNAPIPPVFDRPPLPQPPTPLDIYNKLKPQVKDKNCNPCNKAPWLPMNYQGTYLPPHNQGLIAAASQEVKVPNFFYAPPLLPEQNVENPSVLGPLPNPHLYPGPMPPLFKAELFDYTSQTNYPVKGNLQHHEIPIPAVLETSSSLPLTSIDQTNNSGDRNLGIPQEGQTIFESHQVSGSRLSQTDFGSQGYSHSNSQTGGVQIDSFSSASHENQQGSIIYPKLNQENDATLIKQHFEESRINQFSEPNVSGNFEHTNFGNNQQFVDSSGLDFQRTDQTLSSSGIGNDPYVFGNTGSGEQTYNADISSNIDTVKDSHALGTDGFSNVENPIYFEQSPLTDLTKTSESRTDSPSISSSSSSFVDIDENLNTQTPPDYESSSNSFQIEEEINRLTLLGGVNNSFPNYSTESTVIGDLYRINQINEQKWTNNKPNTLTNKGLQNFDSSFVAPQGQSADSWLVVLSTTMRTIQDETLLDNLGNNQDTNRQNHSLQQYGEKRNKQVQVIIPYTSQYTPLPFHPSYDNKDNVGQTQSRTISFVDVSNRDSYVSQESRNENKVINIPESVTVSGDFNTLDDHITKVETTTEPVSSINTKKINNSIDVHRLQKNIDNWTIQEYSRGTTFSTILPSSPRPYLQPSKKIPNEYFTTTESGEHANNDHEDNVKSFALAGFSFNDIEDEGPNSFEESRIQTIRVENPTTRKELNTSNVNENKLNETTKNSESSWKDFPVSISTIDKERVYVVTPQTTAATSSTNKHREEKNISSINNSQKENVVYSKSIKNKQDEFEKIERAYQVLPQAVNNLAVASTGPETLPLWGIMEHEEFASLIQNSDENNDDESVVAPILYAGHSKVSRARR